MYASGLDFDPAGAEEVPRAPKGDGCQVVLIGGASIGSTPITVALSELLSRPRLPCLDLKTDPDLQIGVKGFAKPHPKPATKGLEIVSTNSAQP